MGKQRIMEIWVGVFVAGGFAALFGLAMQVSNIPVFQSVEGYNVQMRFDNIGGLRVRAPVTMAGVRIGRVSDIRLDPSSYEAVVTVTIERRFDQIPEDSDARIYTSGLLGEQYVAINPGGGVDWYLADGDEIFQTQGALVLERLIGRFLTSMGDD
ncbi:phospholipid/cholesterol/gamma-HCH transport system substrate-binding protein [Natronocella acetinitrilica]|uniref:Phospholipid/cholesterol/gamma-HCH transport system substrate-binding protein n=1 Tax=Natronocella acetinitrilica TaxID=414046 RepID=A0AAE3G2E5_9GAMM|nr:outer membrane lipid asymmetry maintenance protein MlaD [Natronocella acetinitrilica]MCP1673883.1 phospholipid/cholesterol/gamma-HCH transport system substrate-binding protein [Natronocella acetinitrilica]